jgi:hypothetical protein
VLPLLPGDRTHTARPTTFTSSAMRSELSDWNSVTTSPEVGASRAAETLRVEAAYLQRRPRFQPETFCRESDAARWASPYGPLKAGLGSRMMRQRLLSAVSASARSGTVSACPRVRAIEVEPRRAAPLPPPAFKGRVNGRYVPLRANKASSDLLQGFRTIDYVRDWLPIRREQCARRRARHLDQLARTSGGADGS